MTKKDRPKVLKGSTYKIPTGCGKLYVTINGDDKSELELLARIGKAGGCAASQNEAIGRLISLALRYGIPMEEITKQLMGINCHASAGKGEGKQLSCADAIVAAIQEHHGGLTK